LSQAFLNSRYVALLRTFTGEVDLLLGGIFMLAVGGVTNRIAA
jgi:hypothetical protein